MTGLPPALDLTGQARLDRHAVRRSGHLPTVSVLAGPVGAGRRGWAEWMARAGRLVLSARRQFPRSAWLTASAVAVPLPALAVRTLAHRLARDADRLLAEWAAKTAADRQRAWEAAPPHPDDDILRAVSLLPSDAPPAAVTEAIAVYEDRAVTVLVHRHPAAPWPGVLFAAGSADELAAVAEETVRWAARVPALPLAVVVPAAVWGEYLAAAPDGRAKATLREGEVAVAAVDPADADRRLAAAGVSDPVRAALAAGGGADEGVVTAAAAVARATATPPESDEADDRARSAAEAFLFRMLESLPETAGRFELNGEPGFRFGPRAAEVDLLGRELRLAIEIDGYHHFGDAAAYRRDRTKDWELQRRGFVVLRFLAEDVLPRYEEVRDRILDAVRTLPSGGAG